LQLVDNFAGILEYGNIGMLGMEGRAPSRPPQESATTERGPPLLRNVTSENYIVTPKMNSPAIIEATIRTHNLLIVRRVMFRVMSQTPINQRTSEIVPKTPEYLMPSDVHRLCNVKLAILQSTERKCRRRATIEILTTRDAVSVVCVGDRSSLIINPFIFNACTACHEVTIN
jgi:hypothetical protein